MTSRCPFCDAYSNLYAVADGYKIFSCKACGHGFVNPAPDLDILKEFYNSTFAFNYRPEPLSIKESCDLVKHIVPVFKKHMPDARYLLDIGCSYGHELHGYKNFGYIVEGADFSHECARYAKDNYEIVVHEGSVPKEFRAYDIITSRHVIEHVADASAFVNTIRQHLNPAGLVYIVTPNFNSLASRIFKRNWNAITPPGHLQYWTEQSLRTCFEESGFVVLDMYTTTRGYASIPRRGIPGIWTVVLESMVTLLKIRSVAKRKLTTLESKNITATTTGLASPGGKLKIFRDVAYFLCWILNLFTYPLQIIIDRCGAGEEIHLVAKNNVGHDQKVNK